MNNLLDLNIGGDNNDKFYRYKMPPINTSHENTNGGTTIITNFDIIAKSIYRDVNVLEQYFKKHLSANVRVDPKKGLMIRKTISKEDLQSILTKYINTYVLCGSCGNPETEFVNQAEKTKSKQSKAKVTFSCKACGNITSVDKDI